jgi:signal-transduction protein with cAMP-binding, CBS, and nucleotidyltransferase domain
MTLDIAVQRMADELLRVPPFDVLSLDQRVALAAHIRLGVYEALDILPHEEVREVVYVLTRGGLLLRSEPKREELLQAPAILSLRGLRMNESQHWEVVFTEDALVLELPIAELTYLSGQQPMFSEALKQFIDL